MYIYIYIWGHIFYSANTFIDFLYKWRIAFKMIYGIRHATRSFSGQGRFPEIKSLPYFIYKQFILLNSLKLAFWLEIGSNKWSQSEFFSKIEVLFFRFSEKSRRNLFLFFLSKIFFTNKYFCAINNYCSKQFSSKILSH